MRKDRQPGRAIQQLRRLSLFMVLLLGAVGLAAQQRAPEAAPVMVLTVGGPVSPAMSDYIRRNLDDAAERGGSLVVLKMDTPGGLDASMREIIGAILASPVPVATWVAPSGARAASAGTYILYASHVAAMAPATNLGAATPVAIGGGGGVGDDRQSPFPFGTPGGEDPEPGPGEGDEAAPPLPGTAMERKAISDAVAYIRGLAQLRGRDADCAEEAVRAAVSLNSREAADRNVIDFLARDLAELLDRADGRAVTLATGEVTLATAGLAAEEVHPDWRTQILAVITNPNVARRTPQDDRGCRERGERLPLEDGGVTSVRYAAPHLTAASREHWARGDNEACGVV